MISHCGFSGALRVLAGISSLCIASTAMARNAPEPPAEAGSDPQSGAVLWEVVVTAQKRVENLQDVPVSVTALTGEQLEKQQIRSVADLAASVPNLQINAPLSEAVPVFSLRGVSMSDFSLAQNGPIAVYYDEVYKGNSALLGLGLFDLERVEVLRGPQGTLYGKNTTGGAINLISRRPSFNNEGYLKVGYGRYDRLMADGAAEAAFSRTIGARVAFTFERADGWMKNAFPGAPDGNSTRQWGVRGSLRFNPNDILDITVRASASDQKPWHLAALAIPGPDGIGGPIRNLFGLPGDFREGLGKREINAEVFRRPQRTYALAMNADIRIAKDLTLTSITSWDRGRFFVDREDSDGAPLVTSTASYFGRTKQITEDLRLTSSFNGPFNFIFGVFASKETVFNFTDNEFFSDLDVNSDGVINTQDCIDGEFFLACDAFNRFDQEKTSLAAYSDLTYDVTERVTFRGGLRFTRDRGKLRDFFAQIRAVDKTPIINTIPGSETDLFATTSRDFSNENLSGKIGVDFKPTNDILIYASYSRGYRGSAFNAQALFGPAELNVVDPEKVQAVEIGFKTNLFDSKVQFNGAAFWYDYRDQQFLDVDPVTLVNSLANLPKSRIVGAEFELQARPTRNLILSAGVGLLDTEVLTGTNQGVNVKGNRLITAPELSLSSSVDWAIPIGGWGAADARLDVSHTSGTYFDILNRPTTYENGFTVLNSRVRFHPENDGYGVALWVKNLTDTFYRTNMIDASALGYTYTHVNSPRTYGVSIDVKF